ncbi:hypothetical protein Vadar_027613 [Vaccinium darrowii]|uniref:Uncharacterized protein n=1 Tax=Vaccinium darrowii TaxID=229202 RepID=A0ACB7XTM9_9ERIC|nr:hypothetical protein Vadar_027613 [Vaccinium darrowii]
MCQVENGTVAWSSSALGLGSPSERGVGVNLAVSVSLGGSSSEVALVTSSIAAWVGMDWGLLSFAFLLQDVASLNVYNILGPCYNGTVALDTIIRNTKLSSSFKKFSETERPLPVRKRTFGCAWPFKGPVRDGIVPIWPQILNSEEVTCFESVCGRWDLCTDRIRFNHDSGGMIKYHENLTFRGYRALIYREAEAGAKDFNLF